MKSTEEFKEMEAKSAVRISEEDLTSVSGGTKGPTKRLSEEDLAQVSGGRLPSGDDHFPIDPSE